MNTPLLDYAMAIAHERELEVTGHKHDTEGAVRRFNAAIEADRKRMGEPVVWQPIDTAPRDNKRSLYLARLDGDGDLVELDFDGIWEYWQESWELSHINGYCWMSANGIEEPTHWAYQDEPPPTTSQPAEPSDPAKDVVEEDNRRAAEQACNVLALRLGYVWNGEDWIEHKPAEPVKAPSDADICGMAIDYETDSDDTYIQFSEEGLVTFAQALLARYGQPAQSAASAEDGWKLVPVEPTEEMLDAGVPDNAAFDEGAAFMFLKGRVSTWRHMVAAAPTPPADAQDNIIITENGGVQLNTSSPEVANKLFALIDQFRAARPAAEMAQRPNGGL